MSFVNPAPGGGRVVIGNPDKVYAQPLTDYTSSSDFSNALNGILKPQFNVNAQINIGGGNGGGRKSNNSYSNKNSKSGSSKGSSSSGSSGGGGRPHRKYANSNGNSDGPYYPLDPVSTNQISFNTGIKSGTIINPFQYSDPSNHSGLFILGGSFLPPSSKSGTTFESLFNVDIYFKYLTTIQREVNFRTSNEFTSDRFMTYIINLSNALQLYYCVDSVLAYELDHTNRNLGMKHIRSRFSSNIISHHVRLKKALTEVAIPPNLLGFISYMYQNFKFDNTPYGPIYKLEYNLIFHSSGGNKLTFKHYNDAIQDLISDSQVVSLLLKAFPEFRVNSLPPSSSQPIYDPNFKTFWHNANVSYLPSGSNSVEFSRVVEDENTNTYYSHFCSEDVDGIFYACSSIYNIQTGNVGPGLWCPPSSFDNYRDIKMQEQQCSLLCYSSELDDFISPKTVAVIAQSGVYAAPYFDADIRDWVDNLYVESAAQIVQTHDMQNIEQALSLSIEFLFNTD